MPRNRAGRLRDSHLGLAGCQTAGKGRRESRVKKMPWKRDGSQVLRGGIQFKVQGPVEWETVAEVELTSVTWTNRIGNVGSSWWPCGRSATRGA
jgi:hypothetical protein